MLKRLAEYVTRSRTHAILMVVLFSFIPFLGWIGVGIMALITLRQGWREGAMVLLWLALPDVVIAYSGQPIVLLFDFVLNSCMVYALALVLRKTGSYKILLRLVAILGVLIVVAVHGYFPNIEQWWNAELSNYFTKFNDEFNLAIQPADLKLWTAWMAKFATGVQTAIIFMVDLLMLAFGCYMQAMLSKVSNTASFWHGLRNLRANFVDVIVLVVFLLGLTTGYSVAFDLLPVIVMPFLLIGLSLVHAILAPPKWGWLALTTFYLLWVVFFSYVSAVLLILVIADTGINFRKRIHLV